MTIYVEHVDMKSRNDPINSNPNANPNHEKIIQNKLTLTLTLLPGARSQERHRSQ